MKTTCPNCGAELEFRYDDSFVRVCSYCHAAVQRTDRGLESLGQVADLVPIESPLLLFAEGHFGESSFLLVGMAQIRHAAGGIWQEWYAKFDGGKWGWLAEAQGRYYLTFEQDGWSGVDLTSLTPGAKVELPVRGKPHAMTVAEATSGTYITARGELPFKLVPNGTFRYADLSDGQGTFATVDFGDGDEPEALYVGVQVPLLELRMHGGEVGPTTGAAAQPVIKSKRLACPNCNAPIDLRAADQSQRAVCAHCNALLDTSSDALSVLSVLKQKPQLEIPLGSRGTFVEGELTVIGYVQRSALIDGAAYPFDEYLLYRPDLGFRWLVNSDGHWSYVQPVADGAVELSGKGVKYDKVSFRTFQTCPLRVDQVLGEFYWDVRVGETVDGSDYVAPPAMLSSESSSAEETWSLSTYVKVADVHAAFPSAVLNLGSPTGTAPNQPDPWTIASSVMAIGFLALLALGLVFSILAKNESRLTDAWTFSQQTPGGGSAAGSDVAAVPPSDTPGLDGMGSDLANGIGHAMGSASDPLAAAGSSAVPSAAGSADPGPNVYFSNPFVLDGSHNVELEIASHALDNNWVYAAVDLVNTGTGDVVNLEGELEFYSGYDDGDYWTEGTHSTTQMVGPQPAGQYLLRIEGQCGPAHATELVSIDVRQNVFRGAFLLLALVVLGIPFGIVGLVSYFHEKRRWENSTSGKPPATAVALVVLIFAGGFLLIGLLIKAVVSRGGSSSDD